MADLSLDDFIKQKNVKVQIRNPHNKGPIQRRNPPGANPNFQSKPKFLAKPVQRTFDARSKLGPKAIIDARNKIIINKKGGKGDARNKIVQKQVQKGTFDARSVLKKQAQKTNGAQPNPNNQKPPGPITRTLSNTTVRPPSAAPGTQIKFTGNSLQITKRGMAQKPPVPPKLPEESAVPIIQIRNDRYQQRQQQMPQPPQPPPHQAAWQSASQRLQTNPSNLTMSISNNNSNNNSQQYLLPTPSPHPHHSSSTSSRLYSSSQPQHHRRYQDLDDPDFQERNKPLSVHPPYHHHHDMPKINISSLKTVEAAGMRPVTLSRPAVPMHRAPPGAATLSAKQSVRVTMSSQQSGPLKRRQPAPTPQPQQAVGGPLRLGKGGGPGLQIGIGEVSPPKRSRGAHPSMPVEISDVMDDPSKYLSPIQGFRVVVTNLFNGVTQDDIIELFGVVGPLKKARLLKAGSAEVVYTVREDAVKAVQKYHGRELDGQPMYVKMTTPPTAVVKMPAGHDPDITGEALRLYKKPSSLGALPRGPIEVPTILRALFKVGPPAPNKSVKFTVKI